MTYNEKRPGVPVQDYPAKSTTSTLFVAHRADDGKGYDDERA